VDSYADTLNSVSCCTHCGHRIPAMVEHLVWYKCVDSSGHWDWERLCVRCIAMLLNSGKLIRDSKEADHE